MKKRISYSLFFAFLLFLNFSGKAQSRTANFNNSERGSPPAQTSTIVNDNAIHDGKTMVMFTPQFLMIDQIRIEIDRRIAHRHWLSLAPHYVQNNSHYQTHWGLGTVATYRWFVGRESPVYIGGGLQFTHHLLENSAYDDLSQADMQLYKTNITQFGINAIIGNYMRFYEHIYGDIYGGVGYRLSQNNSTDGKPHAFRNGPINNRIFDLGYEGWMLVIGIRVGIML
jgi:hypothetical protein